MKYEELKNEIRDLGFEDDSIFNEYLDIIQTSITRACRIIATTIKAPIGKIDIDLSHDLGITTSEISVGSTMNPIIVDGESVTAEAFNTVSYYEGGKTYTLCFNGTNWQEVGVFDLAELSKNEDGKVRFDSIDRIVENLDNGENKSFLYYDIEEDHILVMNKNVRDNLTVYYNERILPITDSTQDSFKIQVVYPCEPLVALLAAHYVWLDDDERKAILYWNEYDQLKQEIMDKVFKIKARIVGGF